MTTDTLSSDRYHEEYQPSFVEKWDELINWEGRAAGEGGFYEDLLRNAGCERVLDAATGTGYHAVQLRKAGFDVVAADGAANMVAKTDENARNLGIDLPVQQADWRTLSSDVSGRFDAILCLGNAYTHLFSESERIAVLEQFRDTLNPGGIVVIDQRNYDAILDEGFSTKHRYYYTGEGVDARPESITDEYVRFRYEFPDGAVHHLTLFPLRQAHLEKLLKEVGFERIRKYGDFESDFDAHEPDFIVQVGTA